MHDFDYQAPATLADAVALLSAPNSRPLAGGTDLIDHMRVGRFQPSVVVDIKRVPELNVLECGVAGLRLGAAVPCYKIYGSAEIKRDYSALTDACEIIGGMQIQSRASIGGNLCTSGPAADTTPALIALGAVCVIAGQSGQREVAVEAFCTGPGKNVLQPGEVIVAFVFPARAAKSGSHYRRFIPRNEMDIAVVGVGASVTLDAAGEKITAARIGLGAVAPTPLLATESARVIIGQPANDDTYRLAAVAAQQIIHPIDDMRGTIEFRNHITGVLVERVLREAVARAKGSDER